MRTSAWGTSVTRRRAVSTSAPSILATARRDFRVTDSIALVSWHVHFTGRLMETCCFLLKDANECLERGGERGHHCNMNTRCVNVYGSYKCECLPGYVRSDKWNCVEVDECATGQHTCDENSICTNTEGSYNCTCKPGYAADGSRCVPVCDPHCLNGGVCVAPNKCECRSGWVLVSSTEIWIFKFQSLRCVSYIFCYEFTLFFALIWILFDFLVRTGDDP